MDIIGSAGATMKTLRHFVLIASVLALMTAWISGCSKEEPPAPTGKVEAKPEEPLPPQPQKQPARKPPTSVTGYLPILMDARRRSIVKIAVAQLTIEIKHFYGFEGRYPESLEELEKWRNTKLPELPPGLAYDYDPATGRLEVVSAPQQK